MENFLAVIFIWLVILTVCVIVLFMKFQPLYFSTSIQEAQKEWPYCTRHPETASVEQVKNIGKTQDKLTDHYIALEKYLGIDAKRTNELTYSKVKK